VVGRSDRETSIGSSYIGRVDADQNVKKSVFWFGDLICHCVELINYLAKLVQQIGGKAFRKAYGGTRGLLNENIIA
jgi:hypothetical protein